MPGMSVTWSEGKFLEDSIEMARPAPKDPSSFFDLLYMEGCSQTGEI